MLAVSLIVATYNWPKALDLCLQSIQNQTQLPLEVLIADDGSGEETKALIQKLQKNFPVPLLHIWHEDNGFRKSIVLNKAIKSSSGSYIVQVDGDVILNPHFIEDHYSVIEQGFFVRGTRAHISEARISQVYKQQITRFNWLSPGIINRFNAIRFPLLAFLLEKKRNNSNSVRGSNLAYWKSDFILINGYNNDLQGWGHEDEELAARFINNGILKKIVKFKAVQFHLSHPEASRTNESHHADAVRYTLQHQLKTCANGYQQA
ncbi:glycosyltransferase family 2 protein [Pedobacter gandavensis]|uniref:glycosyltransferase family 2 protein n=1 Tax=Pedobacter gandavensis TaxID=2679963 RepID=UPI00292CE429|nr:glycosyltransferase family 2 protein [Pedobacter gandavensis]